MAKRKTVSSSLGPIGGKALLSLLIVTGVSAALLVVTSGRLYGSLNRPAVAGPKSEDGLRQTLRINGNHNHDYVSFNHAEHQKRLGGEEGCRKCHHLYKPNDYYTPCHSCHVYMTEPVSIFDHQLHEAKEGGDGSCPECHDLGLPKSRQNARACVECHEKNMGFVPDGSSVDFDNAAPGYEKAMHGLCVGCHQRQGEEKGRPELADCDTCHKEVSHEGEFIE